MHIRAVADGDWPAVENLLLAAGLPLAGAREHIRDFVVAESEGKIVACGGLERHGESALLRSIAVDPDHRGNAVGETLVRSLIERCASDGCRLLVLLTTTASGWFPRFGFVPALREDLPAAMNASEELRGACPASATVMVLTLNENVRSA